MTEKNPLSDETEDLFHDSLFGDGGEPEAEAPGDAPAAHDAPQAPADEVQAPASPDSDEGSDAAAETEAEPELSEEDLKASQA